MLAGFTPSIIRTRFSEKTWLRSRQLANALASQNSGIFSSFPAISDLQWATVPSHSSKHSEPNPYQTALAFDEVSLPVEQAARLRESTLPPLASPPEYIPVYTVFLRRSDVISRHDRPIIRSPRDAADLVWQVVKESDRENSIVLLLDTKNQIIGLNVVSVGILDSALVHPREVFKAAILANAASVILAHNHPSGDPTPSAEDRRVTQRIHEAGQILGIEVLDHVIVGAKDRFASLKERGLF